METHPGEQYERQSISKCATTREIHDVESMETWPDSSVIHGRDNDLLVNGEREGIRVLRGFFGGDGFPGNDEKG